MRIREGRREPLRRLAGGPTAASLFFHSPGVDVADLGSKGGVRSGKTRTTPQVQPTLMTVADDDDLVLRGMRASIELLMEKNPTPEVLRALTTALVEYDRALQRQAERARKDPRRNYKVIIEYVNDWRSVRAPRFEED